MKINLSPVFKGFKKDIEENFKEITNMNATNVKGIMKQVGTKIDNKFDELKREVRAIVMPEESPMRITDEYVKAKVDSKGVSHRSLDERIAAEYQYFRNETRVNASDLTVVTSNGTIVTDYFRKSNNIHQISNIAVIGDSVARGSHANTNFGNIIAQRIQANVQNFAIGGATMADVDADSIYRQARKIRNADLIIVQGTDDDWLVRNGIPIGTDKTNINEFYGGFYQTIQYLKNSFPLAKILVMTATRQCPVNQNGVIRRKDTDHNTLGLNLEDYVNAQVIACNELNVPVYDAYHTNVIEPYNPGFRRFNMVDGLHPNEKIHEIYAYELVKNFYWCYG
ncbi:TPA: SGNH/GDSL hydrolase family protein [Staphylococcus aureus]